MPHLITLRDLAKLGLVVAAFGMALFVIGRSILKGRALTGRPPGDKQD